MCLRGNNKRTNAEKNHSSKTHQSFSLMMNKFFEISRMFITLTLTLTRDLHLFRYTSCLTINRSIEFPDRRRSRGKCFVISIQIQPIPL